MKESDLNPPGMEKWSCVGTVQRPWPEDLL